MKFLGKALLRLAAFGILAILILLAALWVERRTNVSLPTPTGEFAVGRTLYDWADNNPDAKRELLVWIWYPAEPGGAQPDDYRPASAPLPRNIFSLLTHDPSKVRGHSLRNAHVSGKQSAYPVAIMRAGASLEVANYSTLAEDLASHGYVVVGFDAPYRTRQVVFPDGRTFTRSAENDLEAVSGKAQERRVEKLLGAWTADIAFVLDRLAQVNRTEALFNGKLDLQRVAVFGHSFGGLTAADFCSRDARCKAGIDVDGELHGSVLKTGLSVPFMFLLSGEGDFSSDAEVRQYLSDIDAVYQRLPEDRRARVAIRGANHFMFSDDGAVLKSRLFPALMRLFGKLHVDRRRQLEATAHCIHVFFDSYLKGDDRPQLTTAAYPEIELRP